MATIKCISSKSSITKIARYITDTEKIKENLLSYKDCSSETYLEEFKETKTYWNKTDGVQYHHVIQSFKPQEVTPELAHELGKELASKFAEKFECIIATHIDKDHIHNHIVVNSVSYEDGRKYQSNKEHMKNIKLESNKLCERENLSIIQKQYSRECFSMAEYKLAEKRVPLWKDQIRMAVDEAKTQTSNIYEMKNYLEEKYKIEVKIQNKNISFRHPENQKFVRGNKLGASYTKEIIENEYREQSQRATQSQQQQDGRLNSQFNRTFTGELEERNIQRDRENDELSRRNKSHADIDRRETLSIDTEPQGHDIETHGMLTDNRAYARIEGESNKEYKRNTREIKLQSKQTEQDFRELERRELNSNTKSSRRDIFECEEGFRRTKRTFETDRDTAFEEAKEVGKDNFNSHVSKCNSLNKSSTAHSFIEEVVDSIIKELKNESEKLRETETQREKQKFKQKYRGMDLER